MGTSTRYSGTGPGHPLIPAWLEPLADDEEAPALPAHSDLQAARTNFSRFARSAGQDSGARTRAVQQYIHGVGGSRGAATRMGASRRVATQLGSFFATISSQGLAAAAEVFELGDLTGRSVREILYALQDAICPPSGALDEDVARNAFGLTIEDAVRDGISLEEPNADQLTELVYAFIVHSVEERILPDITTGALSASPNAAAFSVALEQLGDFIRGSIAAELGAGAADLTGLTAPDLQKAIDQLYVRAFDLLLNATEEL